MASFPLLMAGRFCLPVFPPKTLAPKVPAKATVSRQKFPPKSRVPAEVAVSRQISLARDLWPPGDRHKETVLPDPRREEETLYRLETKRKRGFFYRKGARRDRETVLSLLPLFPTCFLLLSTDHTWYWHVIFDQSSWSPRISGGKAQMERTNPSSSSKGKGANYSSRGAWRGRWNRGWKGRGGRGRGGGQKQQAVCTSQTPPTSPPVKKRPHLIQTTLETCQYSHWNLYLPNERN